MDISRDRSRQPATSRGLGAHFTTPEKKRPGKRKTQVMTTTTFDAARKRQRLEAECVEEQRRLGMESDNICRWFGRELNAVELALKNPLCK